MTTTATSTRRQPPPPSSSALPRGVELTRVWRETLDGPLVKHDHERPVDDRTDMPTGVWWLCPAEDTCTTGEWVFPDRETGQPGLPKKRFCVDHGARLLPGRAETTDSSPKEAARAWLKQRIADRKEHLKRQMADATEARLAALRAAAREEAARAAADMREHIPSAAASAAVLVADYALLEHLDPLQTYATGVVLSVGAVLAYLAVYAGEIVYARRMGYTLKELPEDLRARARSHARWIASGVIASGVWLLIAETIGANIDNLRGVVMALLGAVLTGIVNYRPWAAMVARRREEAERARRAAEEAVRAEEERLAAEAAAQRRREEEAEAARLAAEQAALAEAKRIVQVEDDRLTAGKKFAERWARIAEEGKKQTAGPGFDIWRTSVVVEETRKLTAKSTDGEAVIGWEFLIRAEPGVLAPRSNSDVSPFLLMRRWLASMLEVDVAMIDLAYQPARLSDGSDAAGHAEPMINHGLVTLSESFPLGEPVEHPGAAGVYVDDKGAMWAFAGRDLRGRPVYRRHWAPGQAGGGGRYGITGSGKALALDTPIPAPSGWTTMGQLRPGDQVFDETGAPCTVTFATPVMYDHTCYEVVFSDGAKIVADASHQWVTSTHLGRVQEINRRKRTPRPALTRLIGHANVVLAADDHLVTVGAAVDAVGPEYRHAARKAAQRSTPLGTAYGRNYGRAATYSAHELHRRWVELATASRNASREVEHDTEPVTTEQIAATLKVKGGRLNHAIVVAGPLQYPTRPQPLSPYVLGAWLGDGTSRNNQISTADQEILNELAAEGVVVRELTTPYGYSMRLATDSGRRGSITTLLRQIGVLGKGNKHIPADYLYGSVEQRLALMQGLMDTDGYCTPSGTAEFTNTNKRLAHDVLELALGLGFKATMRTKRCAGRDEASSTVYTVVFTTNIPVFRLPRKLARQTAASRRPTTGLRYVTDVRPVESVPVRCIQVDSPNHLFLAGRECVPTHNSVVTQDTAIGDLHLGIFPIIHDAGKNAMDFVDFYGIFPVGHTIEHRDVIRESLWAEMKRRQSWTNLRTTKGIGGMEVIADPTWNPKLGGPPIRVTWEEFHMHMKDPMFVRMLGEIIRLQRATAIFADLATQGTGLADTGDNNLREQINEICLQLMRMTDHTARLAGYQGAYKTSDLPRLPGMMVMVDGQAEPVPYRAAFIPRDPQNPKSLIYHLRQPDGSPEGRQILFAPTLPPETIEVFAEHGLIDLWELGKTKSGRKRLQSEADPVQSDVFPDMLAAMFNQATMLNPTKPRVRAEDVVLALLKHDADIGGSGLTQSEMLASAWWGQTEGEWSKGNGVPAHTTIGRACNKLAAADDPMIIGAAGSPTRWHLLPAGVARGEETLTRLRHAGVLGQEEQRKVRASGIDVGAMERRAQLEVEQEELIKQLMRDAAIGAGEE